MARYRAQAPDAGEVLVTMVRRGGIWAADTIES